MFVLTVEPTHKVMVPAFAPFKGQVGALQASSGCQLAELQEEEAEVSRREGVHHQRQERPSNCTTVSGCAC